MSKKKSTTKKLTKAFGLKQEQPRCLKGLAAAGAGKETRFKPGDERLKNNQGAKLQIIPPAAIPKQRKNLLENIANLSGEFVSPELQEALRITTTDGQPITFSEAVAHALHFAAIRGDVNAVKTILQAQQEMKTASGQLNGKIPHVMCIEFVEECTCECALPNHANPKALEQAKALLTVKNGGDHEGKDSLEAASS